LHHPSPSVVQTVDLITFLREKTKKDTVDTVGTETFLAQKYSLRTFVLKSESVFFRSFDLFQFPFGH
jgi:hypothetical protein